MRIGILLIQLVIKIFPMVIEPGDFLHFLMQAAAQSDIHFLKPAADRKHRNLHFKS